MEGSSPRLRAFFWLLLPATILFAIDVWHTNPASYVLPNGHPNVTYYAYSFLRYKYSDVVALYGSRVLYLHEMPYFQNVIEYPVMIGLFMSAMALFSGFYHYFWASSIGLYLAFVVSLYTLWRSVGTKAAMALAFSPLLVVFSVLNWDWLGIMTWGLGLMAYRKQSYFWAGLWIGLGVVTKFFPIVLFPYLGMELYMISAQRAPGAWKRFVGGFVLTAVGINLPFAVLAEKGWSEFFTYNSGRSPDPGIYQWLYQLGVLQISTVNLLSALLTLVGGILLLYWVKNGRLSGVEAATAGLAWWFLCNKVYSPQYMLWLYFAMLWTRINVYQIVVASIAGLMDFWLAMRWLALGTTGNPNLPQFVDYVVPWILLLRDLTLGWVALTPWLRMRERKTPNVSASR